MAPRPDPLSVRLLRRLARAVCRYPRVVFYPQVLLLAACTLLTVRYLQFSTDRNDLVGADKQYHRNFLAFKSDFPSQDELVAVVESEDMEKNRQFVERLGARLAAETNLFTDVIYNNDVKMLGNKALLFFPEADLRQLRQTLDDYRPFLEQFSQATNLHSLFRLINRRFRNARNEPDASNEALVKALPALQRIVSQATDALTRPGNPPSPGLTALFDAGAEADRQIYITFDNGRLYLVTARARTAETGRAAVRRFRELTEITRREVPGVNAAITGEPVLQFDEMNQAQRDSTAASLVALALVALIFVYGYQESGRPIKATVCLVVALGYTMGYTTLVVGHLNILTITFAPMLIGLAIDFGVHLVTRYEEELRRGQSEHEAIETAIVQTGQGIFTGAFTTAAAFFAMALTNFRGIQEMGVICGGGILISLVPMMTLLPVLILRGRQNVLDHQFPQRPDPRARIERWWLDRPWTAIGLTLAACGLATLAARNVGFDYNLLNLQSRGLPAVEFEKKLIRSAEKSVLYCAVVCDSLEEALALQNRVTNLSTVSSADSMALFLTEDQDRKLQLVGDVKTALAGIRFATPDPQPADIPELSQTLWALQGYLGLAAETVARERPGDEILPQLRSLRDASIRLKQRMLSGPRTTAARKLAAYQQALFNDISLTFDALQNQDNHERMRIEDLPVALRNRFVSRDGSKHLVQVYPRKDVWQRENQEAFVRQLRQTLDPDADDKPIITGTPVQLLEYTTLLKDSYVDAALYALGAIALLVLVQFRSLACVFLALLPVAVGALWMVGLMGWKHVEFNPANIMTLPLVVGIGVTNGIHILSRFAEESSPSILAKSTGKAVLVSGLTTIVGFASLMLGKHQGIASLGYVMAVGTATCMIAGITLLPAVLTLLTRGGWSLKKKPSGETGKLDTGLGGTEVKTSIAAKN